MTRYADPTRCPDCGATITTGAAACPVCALSLSGDTAARLFTTLTLADRLLAELRAASVPTAVSATVAATAPPRPLGVDLPTYPARPEPPRRSGLSAASVPKLLLALGAGCLLVAALVFLAVTWSVMGVGGRTATLVGFTAVAGGLTAWMAHRGLRGAAESLALVCYGLLALDVVGADNAGWFGDLSGAGLLVLLGVVLAAAGAAGALAVRRTTIGTLTVAEVVVATGTALVAVGIGLAEWLPVSPSLVASTLVAAGAAVAAHRARMTVAATGAAAVTALAWASLVPVALERLLGHASWRELWLDLHVWPTLVAALLVAGLALVSELPRSLRVTAAATGELLLVGALVAPSAYADPTARTLVGVGVLVAVGALAWLLPRPWGLTAAATQLVAGSVLLVEVVRQAALAADRLVEGLDPVWSGRRGDVLPVVGSSDLAAPWLLPLVVVVLLATLAVLAEGSDLVDRAVGSVPELQVAVVALLAGSVVGTVALYPVALWAVVGLLLVVAAACTTWSVTGRTVAPLLPAGVFLALALVVSLHAVWLTAAALLVALAVTGLVHLASRSLLVSAPAGALFAAALAGAVWTGGHLLDADRTWVAVAGLVALAALGLGAPYAPSRWWVSDAPAQCRTGLEVGAAAAALPLAMAGLMLAPAAEVATWAAVYLTVAGVAVTLASLLRADRRALGWAGGGLLALASWVRLADIGVQAPEAYTLPSAAALLVVGVLHLRRAPAASTMTALAPGLSLALVPSLLWVLTDPTGPRALLLGLGCLGLVLGGVQLRWTAPIALGATVGALLVLRLAAPYVGDTVPRWVLIGAAGALLIGVGATWERRLAEARQVMTYVRALR